MARTCLLVCLLLLLPLQLSARFKEHVDYAVGPVPFSVAVGDFNQDGKLDLAVTSEASNAVGVMLGIGDGTFQPSVEYATGARPTTVIVADFNADGRLDLAVANGNAGSVSVLFGNGDGTFQPHSDYGVGINDQFLVAADFNGDGASDLATSDYSLDYGSGTASVLLNNGDGAFQPALTYDAGINPFGIMAGDFNRDDRIDLAVVDNNGYFGVQILLGNGDGSFQPPAWYSTGMNPRAGVVADFNGDGFLDLAIANCIENSVSILFGDGQGHFSSPVNYGVGPYVNAVAGADFNLDGKLDLVAANSSSVSVLHGNGDGTFQASTGYETASGANAVAVGDFNGDGLPDLVTANRNSDSVSVLLNERGELKFKVLYRFSGFENGGDPGAGVIGDASGNIFGTTGAPAGTVFEITRRGEYKLLYEFSGTDGTFPNGDLLRANGNLYGITSAGGTYSWGTVFQLTPLGLLTVLHNFAGVPDGSTPTAGLMRDKQGNLYGTTSSGGAYNQGTVFVVSPNGAETVLYSFTGGMDGGNPEGSLIRNWKGNLYGTTGGGGAYGMGTVFALTATGTQKVLHSFNGADGASPAAGLVGDGKANFYGTTLYGGAYGRGTVFAISKKGKHTVLYNFDGQHGENPRGRLVRDTQGNIYGVTYRGGAYGQGTVFEVSPGGSETVLYSFTGLDDGGFPWGSLFRDRKGNLYGTTTVGGIVNWFPWGWGTVFELVY